MYKHRFTICFFLLVFFAALSVGYAAPPPSIKTLVEKNIQAAGGKDKLAAIKNAAFRIGSQTVYLSRDGRMKVTSGKAPAITMAILVDQHSVKRNYFNEVTEIRGKDKGIYQAEALLRCGLFTLMNFEDMLESEGLKQFGPEQHYKATAQIDELKLAFYLDADTFLIKRMVFQGYDPVDGKHEVNLDFGPYRVFDGINIPASWFRSQVGIRGELKEIADVKWNQAFDDTLFSTTDINIGKVKIEDDVLYGNITDFGPYYNMLSITTNWQDSSIVEIGFEPNDKLILQIGGESLDIVFFDTQPPGSAFAPGAKIMFPNPDEGIYLIFLIPPAGKNLSDKLKPLLPIEVRRKT